MTEHKFTDEDVIKALECHKDYWADNCFECPYQSMICLLDNNCVTHLSKDALDLINRQRAEIERIKAGKACSIGDKLYIILEDETAPGGWGIEINQVTEVGSGLFSTVVFVLRGMTFLTMCR